jgi:very-short-patch-repair endonuclease
MTAADYQTLAKRPATTKAFAKFDQYLLLGGFGAVEHEFQFHPVRKWRFDWALPDRKIAWEYDGLMQADASHSSVAGILRDVEKINEAQALGWTVYRVNAKSIHDGSAFTLADRVLGDH